jgi:hypothetical protein
MAIRIPWDKYEAALLLDYCIKVENGEISKAEAVSTVSRVLRSRATRKGYEIDDVFRNENGISMQISSMRNCYLGKNQGLTISKLFFETVNLQKNDPEAFNQVLQEKSDNMETSLWQKFLLWLKQEFPKRERDTLSALMMVNALGRKSRVLKCPLGDITDPEEIDALIRDVGNSSLGFQSRRNINVACQALELYMEYLKTIENDYVEEAEADEDESSAKITDAPEILDVDFHVSKSYAHTKPVSCAYKNQTLYLSGWNAVFHALVQKIYNDYKAVFPVGQSLSSSSRIDTGVPDGMIYPKEIADGIYLECNVNSTGVINKLRSLIDICGMGYEDIRIQYRITGKDADKSDKRDVSKPKWKPKYTDVVAGILSAHYKYGFRLGSPIDLMKFRNYAEVGSINLPVEDEELEKEIAAAGVAFDGKIYIFSAELLEGLGQIIDGIFESGVVVIFLSSFMEIQEEWLEANHVSSEALLKEIIRRCRPSFYLGQNILTKGKRVTEHEAVVSEIHRIAGASAVIWINDLSEYLPYIPDEKIAWSLSASNEFVRISEGKYFRMARFICSKEDNAAILNFVSKECSRKGYVPITDIPMGSIPEENYELSTTALYQAVFNHVLKNSYYLNGKIITADQSGIDITVLLKAYCQDREECTTTEMMERAEELTGTINKQYSLIALYDSLVRVDADRFVSEKQVHFDVDRIDALLESIVGDRFAPIRKVATFVLFPLCGQNWNHYLLESYCYRFSRKYRISVLNYNDKNAGIIASIDLPLTYNEMLSEAAAKADVELTQEAVGEYFFENGFTAKRKYSSMPEIIEKAKTIRDER